MLRELGDILKNPSAVQLLSAIASIVSVAVALKTTFFVSRMLRRSHRAKEDFRVEVDPWMSEAKQKYIKDRFEGAGAKQLAK